MGEAKRRRQRAAETQTGKVAWVNNDDARVQAMFEAAGEPVTVALIGAGLIMPSVISMPFDELMKPQHRLLRLAFGVFDRIRTGEVAGECGLCGVSGTTHSFSCYAVVERSRGTSRKKPALVLPICHSCDSVSTEETQRRVMETFPLGPMSRTGSA